MFFSDHIGTTVVCWKGLYALRRDTAGDREGPGLMDIKTFAVHYINQMENVMHIFTLFLKKRSFLH